AFQAYADSFPAGTVLLVDTYDTLHSGVPNAITVARRLREKGYQLQGIRLDSGDLAYLSRRAREMLDEAGFPEVRILASNEIDEEVIASIVNEGGRVDIYGVGTKLATGAGAGGVALNGVYKLVAIDGQPKMKITSDTAKATLPGSKRVFRVCTADGGFLQDVVCLEGDEISSGATVYDPTNSLRHTILPEGIHLTELQRTVMVDGRRTLPTEPLAAMAERCRRQLQLLPAGCRRFINPHSYKVSISSPLKELRWAMIQAAVNRRPRI
ncbi:MAG TPA: nicotinate phosphoribosyltransferase, partial [Desulforhopalus sp.]|nr:nicotinate phosphoribosyltransferase [Desulforhopalus sp.]